MLHRTIETAIMKVSATKLFFDIFWTAAFSLSLSRAAWLVAVSQRRPLLHSVAKSL